MSKSSIDVDGSISPYSEYLNSAELSDIRVIVDGEAFQCHKVVLANSIPWFKSAFNFDKSCDIVFKDFVHISGFKEILKWCYVGKFSINADNIVNLIESSYYLNVDYIHDKCLEHLEKIDVKDKLIEVFITTWNHNNIRASEIIRNLIWTNFVEILNEGSFAVMTLAELKALLFYKKEVIAIHPKLTLMAIMQWICSNENHLTEAKDLLNSLDLMRIHKDDMGEVCEDYKQAIEDHPVNFTPIFLRLLEDNDPSQLYVPKPAITVYVASVAKDFVTLKSYSLNGSVWSLHARDIRLKKPTNFISSSIKESFIGFGVYGGSVYFLVKAEGPSECNYAIKKIQKKRNPLTNSYYWDWIDIALPMQRITHIEIMKYRTKEFTIIIRSGRDNPCYSYCWSDIGWIQEQVADDEKYHFLFKFSDNRYGEPTTLCSVPIMHIPQPPDVYIELFDCTAVCTSNDEVCLFSSFLLLNHYVWDTNKKEWNRWPKIPSGQFLERVELATNIDGRTIVILKSNHTFELDSRTKSWIKLSNIPKEKENPTSILLAFGY